MNLKLKATKEKGLVREHNPKLARSVEEGFSSSLLPVDWEGDENERFSLTYDVDDEILRIGELAED